MGGMHLFPCPHCSLAIQAVPEMAGQLAACPQCGGQFQMPGPASQPRRERRAPSFIPIAVGATGSCLAMLGVFLPAFTAGTRFAETVNLIGYEPLLGGGVALFAMISLVVSLAGGHGWHLLSGTILTGLAILSYVVTSSRLRVALDESGRNLALLQPQYGWACLMLGCALVLASPFVASRYRLR